MKNIEPLADDAVTALAIGSIAYLGLHGGADPTTLMALAGLGGYRMKKRAELAKNKS